MDAMEEAQASIKEMGRKRGLRIEDEDARLFLTNRLAANPDSLITEHFTSVFKEEESFARFTDPDYAADGALLPFLYGARQTAPTENGKALRNKIRSRRISDGT